MRLPSRHRILNSNPRGLRSSTLPRMLPTILNLYEWMGKKHFCFFQTAYDEKRTMNSSVKGRGANHYPSPPPFETWRPSRGRTRDLWLSKQTALTTSPGPRPDSFIAGTGRIWRLKSSPALKGLKYWRVFTSIFFSNSVRNRLLARVCAVNNCLIKTVQSCSLCGMLSLKTV